MNPLSRSSEYAIRALTYLAQNQGERKFHLVREMADQLGIPAPFLGKVLQPLVNRGILESQRGRRGGFRLSDPPEKITLYDVVDAEESLSRRQLCFLGQSECNDEVACPLHDYWKEASKTFIEQLSGTTVADLARFCHERPESFYPSSLPDGEET